jgi:hypothetical protein
MSFLSWNFINRCLSFQQCIIYEFAATGVAKYFAVSRLIAFVIGPALTTGKLFLPRFCPGKYFTGEPKFNIFYVSDSVTHEFFTTDIPNSVISPF